jgi:hypothetical protein
MPAALFFARVPHEIQAPGHESRQGSAVEKPTGLAQ